MSDQTEGGFFEILVVVISGCNGMDMATMLNILDSLNCEWIGCFVGYLAQQHFLSFLSLLYTTGVHWEHLSLLGTFPCAHPKKKKVQGNTIFPFLGNQTEGLLISLCVPILLSFTFFTSLQMTQKRVGLPIQNLMGKTDLLDYQKMVLSLSTLIYHLILWSRILATSGILFMYVNLLFGSQKV